MTKRFLSLVSLIVSVLLLSGCWDALEINKRNILSAVVVDRDSEGFHFYAEVVSVSAAQKGGGQGTEQGPSGKYTVLHGVGPSFPEAREDLDRKSDHPIFLGALGVIVFTRRCAASGLEEILNRIRQNPYYRSTISVIVTADKAEAFLADVPENDPSVGFALDDTLQVLEDDGSFVRMTLGRIFEAVSDRNGCFLLPGMGVKNEEISLLGYSVFKDGSCIGDIPVEHAHGLVLMLADSPVWHLDVPFGDSGVAVELRMAKRDIRPGLQDDTPSFSLDFAFSADVLYQKKAFPLDEAAEAAIAAQLEKIIKAELYSTLSTSQKVFACDYLRFHERFRVCFPAEYEKMDWNAAYPGAGMSVSVSVDLGTGTMMDYTHAGQEKGE